MTLVLASCLAVADAAEPAGPARAAPTRPPAPRTAREAPHGKPAAPEPIVIDGVMRSAMGYLRVFAQVYLDGRPVVGRPAADVLQRARAVKGEYMDLNLAASAGPHAWWTAVLDTGANNHSVNQDTVERFGLGHVSDLVTIVSGADGEGVKGNSWIYSLALAGSNGRLSEQPATPFIPVERYARFDLELERYQPWRNVSPDGANLIGITAIRQMVVEVDTDNATVAMLGERLDNSSPRAFDESLRGITAGPRVRILPPSFRPTNQVVRLPLRFVDSSRLLWGGTPPTPQRATTPMLMGVRITQNEKPVIGNFVFDTGSAATIISRRMAFALGLVPDAGPAYDRPDFQESLTGANNREVNAPGFVLDSIEVRAPDGQIIQWRKVPVLVHDMVIRQADGRHAVQDGILGNNLFLPSTDGELTERGLKLRAAPFKRYWIHGPMGEVWLQKPDAKPKR
jgi:hypothetical protein